MLIKPDDYRSLDQWKYQTLHEVHVETPWSPKEPILSSLGWISLGTDGLLSVKKGYCWDGPSGPSFDTDSFMRGSLFHDALYQLLREGLLLDVDGHDRRLADELLRNICLEDGMANWRAWYVYQTLRKFGGRAAKRGTT